MPGATEPGLVSSYDFRTRIRRGHLEAERAGGVSVLRSCAPGEQEQYCSREADDKKAYVAIKKTHIWRLILEIDQQLRYWMTGALGSVGCSDQIEETLLFVSFQAFGDSRGKLPFPKYLRPICVSTQKVTESMQQSAERSTFRPAWGCLRFALRIKKCTLQAPSVVLIW